MPLCLPAVLIGAIAGLRTFTAPAAVSWAAHLGWLPLQNTPLAFLGFTVTPYVFTLLAIAELIADKLPMTPSRKQPASFAARLVSAALSGGAIGATGGTLMGGLAAGIVGTLMGTLAGYEARTRIAKAIGRDLPVALLEDLVAVGGAAVIIIATPS